MAQTPTVWTVLNMLEWATDYFEKKKVKSPRFSIEWLLADVLSVKRLDLYLSYDRPLSSEELKQLKPLVKRRAGHEPLQYITGETDFHKVKIKVEPGVLIPRQETEQLVELMLKNHTSDSDLKVMDVGTGSGCIPIALKKERPNWQLFATDLSEQALEQAMENAKYNEVEINFARDDLYNPQVFQNLKFDVIISNPPYILPSEKVTLDEEVKNYEPDLALYCESTDKMYSALEKLCGKYLADNGCIYLELHPDYAEEVQALFSTKNWKAELKNDYSDKSRFLIAKKG